MRNHITFRANHITLSPEIEDYAIKRLQSIKKFLDESDRVSVDLSKTSNHHKTGDIFKAEIRVASRGNQFSAVSEQDSLYAAIDIAHDEISMILSSHKDKKHTLWKKGSQRIKDMLHGLSRNPFKKSR